MKSVAAVAVICLFAGFAAARWLVLAPGPVSSPEEASATGFDTSQPVEERIAALERAVSDERFARQLLQEEVFYLTSELERMTEPGVAESFRDSAASADDAGVSPREARRAEWRRRNTPEGRAEMLVEAGFLPAQAEWILKREQELQMDALQARFDAERSGEPLDWTESRTMASDALRAEMGDADYERYLEASDRPTSISVSSVIESSPAQTAGLRPGDEIVRYDGERVFSMTDLTRQTMEGEAGESVIIEVTRDGTLMQVVLPRGPVGITGGRRRY
jgi:hypothetical protein